MLVLDKKNPSLINPRNRHFLFDLKLIFYSKPHVQVRKWKKEKAFECSQVWVFPREKKPQSKRKPQGCTGQTGERSQLKDGRGTDNLIILVSIQEDPHGLIISSEKDNGLILKSLKFEIPGAKD